MKVAIARLLVLSLVLASPYAAAQQASSASASATAPVGPEPSPATQAPASAAPALATTPPATQAAAPADAGRFRFGINPTVGLETVSASNSNASLSGAMYGLDVRLGWQFNDLLSVYAHPHLSFGSLGTNGGNVPISGFTGTIVGTAMAEVTLMDRLFVGAGAGYGVLNNPSGLAVEGRFGGYPLMARGPNGVRRKGLMIGGDVRAVFVEGATGTLLMGCLGYEAF